MLRRRPLMRAAATTAVVAGTATAVSGRVSRRQQGKADQAAAAQAQAAPPPPPQEVDVAEAPPEAAPVAGGLTPEAMAQLQQLADLNKSGVLTDDEFAAQKARILGA